MAPGGATREHALIAFTMGVRQIIVVVNQMDDKSVNYDEQRFKDLAMELATFLQRVGFNPERVRILPASGWAGQNLSDRPSNMKWYQGPSLLEAMNALEVPPRSSGTSLRIPIQDVYRVGGVGIVPVGRVEVGTLKPDDQVVIAPGNIATTVKSIEMHHQSVDVAQPGDFIGFNLKGLTSKGKLCRGMICGPADDPPLEALSFVAQIIVLNVAHEITVGFTPVIDIHTAHVPCKFVELISRIDRHTGEEIEKNPKCLRNNDAALVRLVPQRPVVVEPFGDCPPLSRFTVRDIHRAVAVGIVKSVKKKPAEGLVPAPQAIVGDASV
jgi:elongation factor 1-alpha